MTQAVMSDAQMGMFQVIRPFSGFEAVYQGQDGTIPIAFPGTLDPEAGRPGMNPNLLAGIPVPLGSRVLLQIPMTAYGGEDDVVLKSDYEYQLVWRTRNQAWFSAAAAAGRQVSAYHLPSEEVGRDAVLFIPGASEVELFPQTEPGSGPAIVNVVQQRYRPKLDPAWVQPLLASGEAASWQQGTYRSQVAPQSVGPTWSPLWLRARGDELLILAYKVTSGTPWDFQDTIADLAFSNTYGNSNGGLPNNPNIGIIVSTGTTG